MVAKQVDQEEWLGIQSRTKQARQPGTSGDHQKRALKDTKMLSAHSIRRMTLFQRRLTQDRVIVLSSTVILNKFY